jgi:hypothetical protein
VAAKGPNVGGGGGTTIIVQEDDITKVPAADTVDFGHGIDVTQGPSNEANVVVDEAELALGSIGGTLSDAQHGVRGSALHSDAHAQNHTDSQHTDGPNSKPGHTHSGLPTVGTTTIDFGVFPGSWDTTQVITGQTGIVAGSVVKAWVRPVATADHNADEHWIDPPDVIAGNIVAGTGFTIYGRAQPGSPPNPPPYGLWTIAWEWA